MVVFGCAAPKCECKWAKERLVRHVATQVGHTPARVKPYARRGRAVCSVCCVLGVCTSEVGQGTVARLRKG
eukprot:3683403-Prymnesium_polylepis.1